MFGRSKKKKMAEFIKADTEKVLSSVSSLSSEIQHECAIFVLSEVLRVSREWEGLTVPSPELDKAVKTAVSRAMEYRHQALLNGATDDSDPAWAGAALLESYMQSASGEYGRDTFQVVDGLILEWIRGILSPDEIEKIANGQTL